MGEKTKSPQKTSQKVQSRQEDRQALVKIRFDKRIPCIKACILITNFVCDFLDTTSSTLDLKVIFSRTRLSSLKLSTSPRLIRLSLINSPPNKKQEEPRTPPPESRETRRPKLLPRSMSEKNKQLYISSAAILQTLHVYTSVFISLCLS